jgi:hypothetical protein
MIITDKNIKNCIYCPNFILDEQFKGKNPMTMIIRSIISKTSTGYNTLPTACEENVSIAIRNTVFALPNRREALNRVLRIPIAYHIQEGSD